MEAQSTACKIRIALSKNAELKPTSRLLEFSLGFRKLHMIV